MNNRVHNGKVSCGENNRASALQRTGPGQNTDFCIFHNNFSSSVLSDRMGFCVVYCTCTWEEWIKYNPKEKTKELLCACTVAKDMDIMVSMPYMMLQEPDQLSVSIWQIFASTAKPIRMNMVDNSHHYYEEIHSKQKVKRDGETKAETLILNAAYNFNHAIYI
ncbi:hypothetical protein BCR41DRAFT_370089 [Lobosporangium transversale]|uniref:Uncharacterized protein n=1 Tax=Lobosporangium transversale TaxID=64571 RepID=A0A1Y2GS24_9FUNG|nr:hypothetical protein BCR41DRAFT_370089 [Lobosporangium transversale]ORZ18285.1 hypothetical protein BCR41DRAFT_370089 [Lobosporangium transversale]|eukprot:XP_021882080.1 hypothetical protein BCR41DRAFT_370089 [Lobosporangium transversale]